MTKLELPPRFPAPRVLDKDHWPPDYAAVFGWRQRQLMMMRRDPMMKLGAYNYYREHKVEFILHWVDTYDPRNAGKEGKLARMPMIMFPRQEELVEFLEACINAETDGLIEKCRDMGATWVCCAVSIAMWLFVDGSSIGWGSRKEALVDKLGDPDSIFEKLRMILRYMPPDFLPENFNWRDHATFMRLINPVNGASITGEAGDNIGRGGRKLIYFKDESAHYERPERIEAALGDNTRVQIDISSVHGLGNMFHRRREAGVEWNGGPAEKSATNVFIMDWRDHPEKDQKWYDARKRKAEREGQLNLFAQEVDRDYSAAVEGTIIPANFVESAIDAHIKLDLPPPEGKRIAGAGRCVTGVEI